MMIFKAFDYDENFDFKKGELPQSLQYPLGDQLGRVREVLAKRSNEQIAYGLESLDWLLRKGSERLLMEAMKAEGGSFLSRPKALRHMQAHVDLSDQSSFSEATWAEYFALLALLYVVEWLYIYKNPNVDRLPGAEPSSEPLNPPVEYAVESMDAVSYAECLSSQLEHDLVKEAARSHGSKGGLVRAEKFNVLKTKVLALYDEKYTTISNRQAAMKIWNSDHLSDDDKKTLTSDEPEKRLEIWIGKHKKVREYVLNETLLEGTIEAKQE